MEPDRDAVRLAVETPRIDVPAIPLPSRTRIPRIVPAIMGQSAREDVSIVQYWRRSMFIPLHVRPMPLVGLAPSSHCDGVSEEQREASEVYVLTCYCVVGGVRMHPRCLPSYTP